MDAESKRLAYQPIAHSVLHWGQMDLPKFSPFGDFTLLIFICLIFMILLFRMANDEYEILSYTLILNCVDYYSAYYLMPWNFLLPNVLVSLFWPNFFWNHQSSIYLSFFILLMVFLYSFWFFNQRLSSDWIFSTDSCTTVAIWMFAFIFNSIYWWKKNTLYQVCWYSKPAINSKL